MKKLKRAYNKWLFKKYGFDRGPFFENIPVIYRIMPLFSPSVYGIYEGEKFADNLSRGFNDEYNEMLFKPTQKKSDKKELRVIASAMDFYDKEEIYPNCTVQVLTNTITGECSVGWWENKENPADD